MITVAGIDGARDARSQPDSGIDMADYSLDAKGLACPLPLLKAKASLQNMAVDETLEVLSTDPGSEIDFEAFCRATGHALLEHDQDGAVFRFVLRKTA